MEYKFIHIPKCAGTSVRNALQIEDAGHTPVSKLPRHKLDDIFTFSFVRNPYGRIASFYRYLRRDDIRNIKKDNLSFQDWFYLTLVEQKHFYYYRPQFFASCYDWVSIEGEIAVDFIGKVENMEMDWIKLCEKLDKSVILDQYNSTKPSKQTFTKEMNDIIQERYRKDLETWYPKLIN